jgi:uncharacterized membrane protein YqgA involved in biofilm formation
MEGLPDLVMYGASASLVIYSLVGLAKRKRLKGEDAGLLAIGLGMLFVGLNEAAQAWPQLQPVVRTVVIGCSVGILAMGAHSSGRAGQNVPGQEAGQVGGQMGQREQAGRLPGLAEAEARLEGEGK